MRSRDAISVTAVLAAAMAVAAAIGAAVATGATNGIAVLLGIGFVGLALVDLAAAIAVWAAITFLIGLPGMYLGERVAVVVIFAGWLVTLVAARSPSRAALRRRGRELMMIVPLLLWLLASVAWATNLSLVDEQLWRWYAAVLMAPVVATTLDTPRKIRRVAAGLLTGASVSVAIGFLAPDIAESAPYYDALALEAGRLYGAATDPNLLAQGIIAAVALGVARLGTLRLWGRFLVLAAVALGITGIVASASRGAIVGSGVAVLAAPLLLRGRRGPALAGLAITAGVAVAAFTYIPSALERINDAQEDNSGGGRTALWVSAWRMAADHPLLGVGVGNYPQHSPEYITRGGQLDQAFVVAEQRLYAHNVYLQQAAETGFTGLALYLFVLGTLIRAAWRAGRRLDALGHRSDAALAWAALIGALGLITTSGVTWWIDARLWLLLGIGVALLDLARRRADSQAALEAADAGPWAARRLETPSSPAGHPRYGAAV